MPMKETTQQSYNKRVLKVLVYIQQHLDNELELGDLAQIACFSPYHFHRIFKGMVGEPLKEHIRRLRLERAAMRLKSSRRQIIEIAFEAGFETHESFTRAFRVMFDDSPTGFRMNCASQPTAYSPTDIHYQAAGKLLNFSNLQTGGKAMEVE